MKVVVQRNYILISDLYKMVVFRFHVIFYPHPWTPLATPWRLVHWRSLNKTNQLTEGLDGFEANMLQIISQLLNFTFKAIDCHHVWGKELPNKTWDGMIGMVHTKVKHENKYRQGSGDQLSVENSLKLNIKFLDIYDQAYLQLIFTP